MIFADATRQDGEGDENPFGNERVDQHQTNLADSELQVESIVHADQQNAETCIDGGPDGTVDAMTRRGAAPLVDVAREYIRIQISRLGITEKDFGIKVDIPASTLNDLLKGKRRVHFTHLQKIIEALGIDASGMFKVMADISREIEAPPSGYSPLHGRARGYVLADQKEAVRKALAGLRRPVTKDGKPTKED